MLSPKRKRTYKKITAYVEDIGGSTDALVSGFYHVNGVLIDLTASGDEPWQITRNILDQLNEHAEEMQDKLTR